MTASSIVGTGAVLINAMRSYFCSTARNFGGPRSFPQAIRIQRELAMADGSAGTGILGVLVGAVLVIVVGAAVLVATGQLGSSGPSLTIKLPGSK
jgi:hypothetical protein